LQSIIYFIYFFIIYYSIDPNTLITTSHDLKIKLFSADTGEFFDEFRHISNKYSSVPIGIKYRGADPITSNDLFLIKMFRNCI
jgi:hypothetical protein